jgi:c-di-GMP-binding flagellar brake protein YcgR
MVDFVERRKYFRISVDCEINYRLLSSDEIQKARCITLSGGGISFIATEELELETELEVIVQPQLLVTPPLRGLVKVVNVRGLEDQTYVISASMTVLQDEDYLSL